VRSDTSSASLETFIRMIGSSEPVDSVTSFAGSVSALVSGREPIRLFSVEGFCVGRAERTPSGFRWMSREVLIFVDPQTREPIEFFSHQLLGGERNVVHVWNDPRNEVLSTEDFSLRPLVSEGFVSFCRESFRFEKNPLTPARWPLESSGETLSLIEVRRYSTPMHAMGSAVPSVACDTTWTWITPWLPWMLCGASPGHLVWNLSGRKLLGGYRSLSVGIRSFVDEHRPEFAFAPRNFSTPNESIWSTHEKERRPMC
jgi:Protein of unknown function (DUF1838)